MKIDLPFLLKGERIFLDTKPELLAIVCPINNSKTDRNEKPADRKNVGRFFINLPEIDAEDPPHEAINKDVRGEVVARSVCTLDDVSWVVSEVFSHEGAYAVDASEAQVCVSEAEPRKMLPANPTKEYPKSATVV